ncbi:citrulline utilization hydrolase CtlX [Reichenbachiella versicolor]|uniref:citrulline utilization hydrolase CtlX n=1 Tax=Reichenbachiella versicolor TaxID=1821036 RepID=UPI000D6DFDA4|nr:arginine deiminase-related protein [Reichenbachiella versicolor]
MHKHLTNNILMIRPCQFRKNEETAINNYYQQSSDLAPSQVRVEAIKEFDQMVDTLIHNGINVIVTQDTFKTDTPDSIFPNNWISFHEDGTVGLFPMFAENRRLERRSDILERLQKEGFHLSKVIDMTTWETNEIFLEGTGSLVLDRKNKVAFAALSERTQVPALYDFEKQFGYKVFAFNANQSVLGERKPIYHTNVMMCMGDTFCVICLDCIDEESERRMVVNKLKEMNKEIIELTEIQLERFAGNMLQIKNNKEDKILIMSESAHKALDQDQINQLLKHNHRIISSPLDTIEHNGGGSARCMIAEVFLPLNN